MQKDEQIWAYHCKGMSPSQIDAKLHLDAGTAHEVIVQMWVCAKVRAGADDWQDIKPLG